MTFTDLADGRSRIDGHAIYLSQEERDATAGEFGSGRNQDFERLDQLLATLAPVG